MCNMFCLQKEVEIRGSLWTILETVENHCKEVELLLNISHY